MRNLKFRLIVVFDPGCYIWTIGFWKRYYDNFGEVRGYKVEYKVIKSAIIYIWQAKTVAVRQSYSVLSFLQTKPSWLCVIQSLWHPTVGDEPLRLDHLLTFFSFFHRANFVFFTRWSFFFWLRYKGRRNTCKSFLLSHSFLHKSFKIE